VSFDANRHLFATIYIYVSKDKNLAALVPCLMGVDVTFFFFPMSEEEFSSSSSDTQEKYFSA
jgi:hypothetical protein